MNKDGTLILDLKKMVLNMLYKCHKKRFSSIATIQCIGCSSGVKIIMLTKIHYNIALRLKYILNLSSFILFKLTQLFWHVL